MDYTNNTVFPKDISLPNKVFDEKMHYFLAFEPSFVSDEAFYPCLSRFSREVDGDVLISIEVLDDNDLKCLNKICKIDNNIQFRESWDNIFNANCKCIYSQMIGIYSESMIWGVYVDNVDFEIGLVGFESEEQMNLFLEIFKPELDVFESVKDYVEETDSILEFSTETREKFNAIVQNYEMM